MAYTMHRIFCGAPAQLEPERQTFLDVVSALNEAEAMPRGLLLVPVSIMPYVTNKRPFQSAMEANVRECRFYVQLLQDTWGPPERNFEPEYKLAAQLGGDPASLMKGVALFFKEANGLEVDPWIRELKKSAQSRNGCDAYEFTSLEQYKKQLQSQLSAWLRAVDA
jgi:hypothetical protein